jgi:hypothetical protein
LRPLLDTGFHHSEKQVAFKALKEINLLEVCLLQHVMCCKTRRILHFTLPVLCYKTYIFVMFIEEEWVNFRSGSCFEAWRRSLCAWGYGPLLLKYQARDMPITCINLLNCAQNKVFIENMEEEIVWYSIRNL